MADVFISYSRQDQAFVRQLFGALEVAGQDAWVDWEDIPLTTDWWAEIREGIEEAKAFIFVMTPASLSSQVCTLEVTLALQMHKRIIPVLPVPFDTNAALEKLRARTVDDSLKTIVGGRSLAEMSATNWQTLSSINWVQFADRDFDEVAKQLLEVLQTDYDHAKTHTRLLQRALEWDRAKRANTLLLRGDAQREAEAWVRYNADKIPKPTDIHREYVAAGIHLRLQEIRRLRTLLTSLVVLLVIAIGAGLLALSSAGVARSESLARATQQAIAEQNAEEAENLLRDQWLLQSLFLAGQSHLIRQDTGDPTSFLNLALESLAHYDEGIFRVEAQTMLIEALNHPLQLKAELPETQEISTFDSSMDGTRYLLTMPSGVFIWTPDANTMDDLTARFGDITVSDILDISFINDDSGVVILTPSGTIVISLTEADVQPTRVEVTGYENLRLSSTGEWVWASHQQEDSSYNLKVWSVDGATMRELNDVRMLQEAYFSPNYRYLTIPAYSDQTVLWDLTTDTTQALTGASYTPVRWAGNDVVLIRDVQGTLRAYRVGEAAPKQLFFIGRVVNAVPSPDGTRVAVINADQTLRILRTEDGELLGEMLLFEANASAIVWNDAQDHVMSWGRETILLWALADEFPQSISFLGGTFGFFTDTHAVVAGDESISVIALVGGDAKNVAYPTSPIVELEWNEISKTLAIRAGFGSLRVWTAGNPPQPRIIPPEEVEELVEILPCHPQILGDEVGENRPVKAACTQDLSLAAGVLPDKREIWVWSIEDASSPQWVFEADYPVRSMHFSPDGTRLAVIEESMGTPYIYTIGQKRPVRLNSMVDADTLRWHEDSSAIHFIHPYTLQTEEWSVDVRTLMDLARQIVLRPLNERERAAFFLDITDE